MKVCNHCNITYPEMNKFCTKCGGALVKPEPNLCTNKNCHNSKLNPYLKDDDQYCSSCGSSTTKWKAVHDAL